MDSASLSPLSPLGRLLTAPMRPGRVIWIGVRPGRRAPLLPVARAELDPDNGVLGDHYANRNTRSRQVTLIAQESLDAIASFMGLMQLDPATLRRNIVVRGINLHALKSQTVQVGSAIITVTGECHPCSRMEELFGPGGYNAVRGHGGLTGRVLTRGTVRIGDPVLRLESSQVSTSQ